MTAALPLAHETVVHMLQDAALRRPDGAALVCGDDRMTYREYAACVAGLAQELVARGASGGRVALLLGNSIDIAVATFAAQAAGAQVVPLNPSYTIHELAPILVNASPTVVIHDVAVEGTVAQLARHCVIPHRVAVGADARRLSEWRGRHDLVRALPLPRPDSLSTLQYTGGTTGRPKGVDLTHRAVSINIAQREALLPTEPECERVLAITPLFHVYAVAMGLYLCGFRRWRTAVPIDDGQRPNRWRTAFR